MPNLKNRALPYKVIISLIWSLLIPLISEHFKIQHQEVIFTQQYTTIYKIFLMHWVTSSVATPPPPLGWQLLCGTPKREKLLDLNTKFYPRLSLLRLNLLNSPAKGLKNICSKVIRKYLVAILRITWIVFPTYNTEFNALR